MTSGSLCTISRTSAGQFMSRSSHAEHHGRIARLRLTAEGLGRRLPAGVRRPLVDALVGSAIAAVVVWAGPPGNDLAAHLYQRNLLLHHGYELWDNFWYSGRYSFVT